MISQLKGNHFPTEEQVFNYTIRKPLGVVACISPWNLPLYLFTWKIAPALITGNTVGQTIGSNAHDGLFIRGHG